MKPLVALTEAQIEARNRVTTLAGMIILEVPAKRPANSASAYVRWSLLEELRDALVASGVDMDAARRRYTDLKKEKGLV